MIAETCPLCGSAGGADVVTMNAVPVHCNNRWETSSAAVACPRADIRLRICEKCEMIWNAAFDPDALDYGSNYENALHFSATFQDYMSDLAARLVDEFGIRDREVVEIGSGDGRFLQLLCELGRNRGVGFDPSLEGDRRERDLQLMAVRFSPELVPRPPDLICARHVLEHLPDPARFLEGVRSVMVDDGLVFVEVPNFRAVLEGSNRWDILYEHCLYFTQGSLRRLFEDQNMAIEALESVFGGEFLRLFGRVEGGRRAGLVTGDAAVLELAVGLPSLRQRQIDGWAERLDDWQMGHREIVIWGIGSRGVMFLNTVPGADAADWAIDINPRKRGTFVAGTGQPVVAPSDVPPGPSRVVVVMNPVYLNEVAQMVADLGWDAEFVVA